MAQLTLEQAVDLAAGHHRAGQFAEAEQIYRQILAQKPDDARTIYSLGLLALQVGRADAAADLIGTSIALNPSYGEAFYNLGIALTQLGRIDEAIAAYQQTIERMPNYGDAYNNLGILLRGKGDLDGAMRAYQQAITHAPNNAQALNNLGSLLKDLGRLDESMAAHRQAIVLQPELAEAHSNLGAALKAKGQNDEAIAAYRKAIAINSNCAEAHNNLGNAMKDTGRLDEAVESFRRAIAARPGYVDAFSNLIFTLHHHPDYDAAALAREQREYDIRFGEPLARFIQPHANGRESNRRLRIGYVSPDFREHVLGRSVLPLFKGHDRKGFEIFCYGHVLAPDAITAEYQKNADGWRNIVGLSDEQAANLIREDRIDILVNLNLHTANNRLLVFARKPAPLQVSYLGCCGSTGMKSMDYRLTDPHLDPANIDYSVYTEKTVHLPRSFWCYQPRPSPDVPDVPAKKNGYVTFGCLNSFAKVSRPALDLWARILLAVPDSRMIIHAPPGEHLKEVTARFERAGVAADRLMFAGSQAFEQYMATYSRIDIALDPFPYGGGITTCDALWMGVPVVTLSGRTASGRAGRSILSNIGLTELIAMNDDQYIQIAVDLSKNLDRLIELRKGMRDRMQSSPLMDVTGFARDLEAAYRNIWQAWCSNK